MSRSYDELEVGAVYRSRFGRTVLEADNVWFTLLTLNTNPIHFDARYAATTEWGRPLVDSTFTLALVTGLSVTDVSERQGIVTVRTRGLNQRDQVVIDFERTIMVPLA